MGRAGPLHDPNMRTISNPFHFAGSILMSDENYNVDASPRAKWWQILVSWGQIAIHIFNFLNYLSRNRLKNARNMPKRRLFSMILKMNTTFFFKHNKYFVDGKKLSYQIRGLASYSLTFGLSKNPRAPLERREKLTSTHMS